VSALATLLHEEPGARLLVVAELAPAARALGLPDPEAARALLRDASGPTGRAETAVVDLPGGKLRMHVRRLRHGGWLGGLTRGALLGPRRPEAEIEVNRRLVERGAAVPRPVLSASWRRFGPIWNGLVATEHVEDAIDGVAFFESAPDPARVRQATDAVARAVRRFHDAGGRHPDLHVKNLLLRQRGERRSALVIDLDRAQAGEPPDPARRMRELMRLYRSLVKRGYAESLGARGCARFVSSYTAGDRTLRRALLHSLPRERRRLAWHRAGYRLAGSLSAQRSR
jgi:tRNA A-37 threonylcarbamoyl transferase component Bud32